MELNFKINNCSYGFDEIDLKSDNIQFLLSITSLCKEVENGLESQIVELKGYLVENLEMPEIVGSAINDKINEVRKEHSELRNYTDKIFTRIFHLSHRKIMNRDHKRLDLISQMDSGKCACY